MKQPLPFLILVRVLLATALLSGVVLVLVLFLGVEEGGDGYFELIRARGATRAALGPALVVAALVLLPLTALITGAAALYGSFRIAGPLYRIRRNLEVARKGGRRLPLRRGDRLQTLANDVEQILSSRDRRLAELERLLGEARALCSEGEVIPDRLREILQRCETVLGERAG
ncbi:MAG TPA: hypothetical protein ENK54_06215 [Thiotrichales bacterium]|nr:hypothetical protein [Thiotrichales bacterium]